MKTRNEIYQGEGAKLLRFITTYHTLRYDQVLQLFSRHEQSIKSLITSLIKQGRIIYDKEHDLLCDSQQSAENPDYAIITCFWVLLDFKKGVVYHTSGEFPIKLNFFSQDEQYEIIYIGEEQEALMGDARERFQVGDHILVRILDVRADSPEQVIVHADVKSVEGNTSKENMKKCKIQGKYAGTVEDIHKGTVFVRLSIGVNAIAHSCYDSRTVGKKDQVSFVVTHIDEERNVALGIITRIIKQTI